MQIPYLQVVVLFILWLCIGCAAIPNHKIEAYPIKQIFHNETVSPSDDAQISQFNIPIVINKQVEKFIQYFQTSHRRHFVRWLSRSRKYIPVMQKILEKNNLPTDLVYIAMIESGFNSHAYSRAHAVGPWQFIKGTGKRYGLKTNWWVDERRDPIKSTISASQYLKDLYDMFGSWFLAAAGYNAGENKIKKAIIRHNTEDFWEMTNYRYLRAETKQYIPKLIAAALIAKNPEKYGFEDIEYADPLLFESVIVQGPTDLRSVAEATSVSYEEIRALNPELLRWCTPPDEKDYELRIPYGKKELFLAEYENMKPKELPIFHTHKIKMGDTLFKIARTYKTPLQPILELNNITSVKILRPGQHLIIPVKAKIPLKDEQQT